VVSGRRALTWPRLDPLDELPLVPFLFGPGGENLYDSTAIGEWLDRTGPHPAADQAPLLPTADAAVRLAARFADEALDELGLYLVHHNRWVVAARGNDAGERLARQMRPLLGPAAALLARRFPARQVRRLPYLFSVADPGDPRFRDLPAPLRPPARPGFPPTHGLLERLFGELLAAVEPVLAARPFLFGRRFGLADASLYGQLGMNRTDPEAWRWIQRDAPATAAWVERLAVGDFRGHRPDADFAVDPAIQPFLAWIARGFAPLMQQNHAAWERHRDAGETLFNEAAFDAGRALYDGSLAGHPYRSVAKTFQARVWRDLLRERAALAGPDRRRFDSWLPIGPVGAETARATISGQPPRGADSGGPIR
jgi:glutathione S-transferase